ncbi:rRNA-processing protein and EBNA1-binding protein ebp2 [Orbilia javanica]|uniref:rRNA-processing protein and EBNA1-binding protein ebp2 n=1 Tax=Orbilia javanica TaxID=47235 RepID=A0AAN8RKH8_9PEZI
MAKAKLRQILAADKGKVPYLEKQKKLQKEARKRKRVQDEKEADEDDVSGEEEEEKMEVDGEWESESDEEDSEDDERVIDMSKLEDSDSEEEDDDDDDDDEDEEDEGEEEAKKPRNGILKSSKATTAADKDEAKEDDDEEDEEDDEDIPLSEISEEDQDPEADIIPRQKLTIDNHSALTASQASIALPIKKSTSFSLHHTITTSTPVEIKDVHDDLTRELAFYTQALDAAKQGRALLLAEGAPFTRPTDYFAEMVKSEEHMGKIKEKIKEQAAMKQASADAKRQRDLKKFGKQVQVARLQERQKEKREMLDKINVLKRKRAGADLGDENEGDPFDIAIEKAEKVNGREGRDRRGGPNAKRQKKNEKFGYGGKKKFSKSGDAVSSGDLGGFNSKGMKKNSFGSGKKAKAPRPGKSKRQARR